MQGEARVGEGEREKREWEKAVRVWAGACGAGEWRRGVGVRGGGEWWAGVHACKDPPSVGERVGISWYRLSSDESQYSLPGRYLGCKRYDG